MVENELLELIQKVQVMKCESQTIELKSAHLGCPKRLYDTLSSFSNQDTGGILLFGIDENQNYEIVGVYDIQDLQKKVNEQCKQMIPIVRPVFTSVCIDNKFIVSAEIPGIDIANRPCYYAGVGRVKGSYLRSGDSDEPMSDYEIYSYEAFRKKYQDDIRINENATMEIIDMLKFESYINVIKMNNPRLSKLDDATIYKFLNMVIDNKPTLSCVLLFSIYPQMLYPQYTINATVIPGYEKGAVTSDGIRFIDNKRIEGNCIDMLNDALAFVSKNMKIKTIILPGSGQRIDKTEYPIIAVREAILNSIIHRDLSIHTEAMPIEVTMYKDRLEIRNPGGLYGRMTLDSLGKVQPDTRNPVLARAMETLGITENRYSGIPTIQREMEEAGLRPAVFSDSRNEFVVTFYNDDHKKEVIPENDKYTMILEYCKEPKTRKEIGDLLNISTTHFLTKVYINPLLKSGKLQMINPEKPKSKNQKYFTVNTVHKI